MTELSVDVVIVAYGSAGLIGESLASVRDQGVVASVMVVDHGRDGTADIAESLGARALRNPANPGFGAGQNAGASMGRAPFVLMLNPDAALLPGAIEEGLRYLDAHPSVAAVQGIIRSGPHGAPERSQGRALAPVHLLGRAVGAQRLLRFGVVRRLASRSGALADSVVREPDRARVVDALAATAILARRAAIEDVRGFDERYFLYGEDMDLSARLRVAGWQLAALPIPWAEHAGGASMGHGVDRELRYWRGGMRYAAQWWTTPNWIAGVTAACVMAVRLMISAPRRTQEIVRELLREPIRERRAFRRSPASAGVPPSPTQRYRGRR